MAAHRAYNRSDARLASARGHALFSTRPATASSFFNSSGSRASGAVMIAVSSARSEPIGQGSCSRGKSRASRAHEPRRLLGIGQQHLDDVGDGDGVVVGVPAVEIGDHGHGRVANLRLARELGLRQIGHADHRIAEVLVGQALGERGELRPLHADIGAARAPSECLRPPRPRRDAGASAERPDAPWTHAPRSPCRRRSWRGRRCGRRTDRPARRCRAAAPP